MFKFFFNTLIVTAVEFLQEKKKKQKKKLSQLKLKLSRAKYLSEHDTTDLCQVKTLLISD